MPIPKANPKESEKNKQAYLQKCFHALKDEKRPQNVKEAICLQSWERRKSKKKSKGCADCNPEWDGIL